MSEIKANEDSRLYKHFPSTKVCWYIIGKAEETLNSLPRGLFLLPTRLRRAETVLRTLKQLKGNGFYKDLASNEELMKTEARLEELIKELRRKMEDLKIVVTEDPITKQKHYSFKACPLLVPHDYKCTITSLMTKRIKI